MKHLIILVFKENWSRFILTELEILKPIVYPDSLESSIKQMHIYYNIS